MKVHSLKPIRMMLVAVIFGACSVHRTDTEVLDYVDTRVGTAASIADITVTEVEEPMGYVSPIVGNPSALTHWTPQTALWTERVITVPVPYWYDQDRIQGFRGTRYPNGSVTGDWGPMCVMPLTGEVKTDAVECASKFSHDHEIAKPHYYAVELDDYNIKTEFTAAAKTAFFQFTFPGSDQASVLFDGVYVQGYYKVIPGKNEIEGYTVIAGHFRNHWVAKFDKKFESYRVDLLPGVVDAALVPGGFKAAYFNNDKLEGEPAVLTTLDKLNYDWLKEPAEGVIADFLSVIYSGTFIPCFSGDHTFELTTKDGTRVYLDEEMVIDQWMYRATGTNSFTVNLTKGEACELRIEYYDGSSTTEMHLRCAEPHARDADADAYRALEGADGNAVVVSFTTTEGEQVRAKVALP